MASEVDICNLALAHLGDEATVASLYPPDGSAQASHCAKFYPIARDSMLDEHPWSFSTRRAALAPLAITPPSQWLYAYGAPSDLNNPLEVYPPDATNDIQVLSAIGYTVAGAANTGIGIPTPQPYIMESLPNGTTVIYTNQVNAVLRYTAFITDTTKFPPLFIEALAYRLASMLAGPVLKGDSGRAEAKAQMAIHQVVVGRAKVSDTNQQKLNPQASPSWLVNR